MNSWQDFLGTSGARFDGNQISDFGDPDGELAAARAATVVSPLGHLGLLECAGEDAKVFLHNMLTSDVNHLAADGAQYSAWCTAKGRMQASFLLYRHRGDYRALLSADLLPAICDDMRKFVLRAKVKLTDLSTGQAVVGVSGPRAESALQAAALPVPTAALQAADFSDGKVIRLDASRFLIALAGEKAPELWAKLAANARPAGTPAWRWLDIQEGIPLITQATRECFVPQMANFDQICGVSFQKGCYPGQEVIARTRYLGKIKRHLYRLHAENALAAGTAIYSPENHFGRVVTAAPSPDGGFDALAVIQESIADNIGLFFDADGKTALPASVISAVGEN